MILPVDKVINVYSYEGEFEPFSTIYEELHKEQKMIYEGKIVCLIPARLNASRFDRKLLKVLKDEKNNKEKTVIRETYERMNSYKIFETVLVVTNNLEIKEEMEKHCGPGSVKYMDKEYPSGTDRICEAAKDLDAEIIFNIQGDEPFIAKEPLEKMIALMRRQTSPLVVSSLMKKMESVEAINSSDYVKVICSNSGNAVYFSRSVIPFNKKEISDVSYFEHVGVYAFTRGALLNFAELEQTPLEKIESIECLRFLENDIPVKMIETDTFLLEIDTEADLINVNNLLLNGKISLT